MCRRFTLRCCLFFAGVLCGGAVAADSAADLVRAKRDFAEVESRVNPTEVNRLENDRRHAIWEQYYTLLEALGRMQVHQEMMMRHGRDRKRSFGVAHSEFRIALEALRAAMPANLR